MQKLWSFLGRKRNREILGWAGGGLVLTAAGLWAVFVYVFPAKLSSGPPAPAVQADCGSVAVGRDAIGTTITAGNATNCPPSK